MWVAQKERLHAHFGCTRRSQRSVVCDFIFNSMAAVALTVIQTNAGNGVSICPTQRHSKDAA